MNDFGGGRRRLKLAWVTNFQKLTRIPLLAIFIFKYQNFSPATWIYMAMQSSYGLVWVIQDLAFPDSSFQKSATIAKTAGRFAVKITKSAVVQPERQITAASGTATTVSIA